MSVITNAVVLLRKPLDEKKNAVVKLILTPLLIDSASEFNIIVNIIVSDLKAREPVYAVVTRTAPGQQAHSAAKRSSSSFL